jgi:single-stranded-DNA-specific exonuclease
MEICQMISGLNEAIELLKCHKNDSVHVVSHIDADGLSSAAILSQTLDRKGIEHTISCHSLDELPHIEPCELTIFSDLGSGQLHTLHKFLHSDFIILDHHHPSQGDFPGLVHVNPTRDGYDGTFEVSGSGVSYFFSRAIDERNVDLSALAIVGACGDMQDSGKLKGLNRLILEDASKNGLLSYEDDLSIFGRSSRPIHKALQYFSDPYIPSISGNERGALAFLSDIGMEVKEGEWPTLADLTFEQKRMIASEMIARALPYVPPELAKYVPLLVIGESYTLVREERGSPLRDANEFATCLNACGRNKRFKTGIGVAKGDRGSLFDEILEVLRLHRENLKSALSVITSRTHERRKEIQVFCGEGVDDTILGTVASMLLSQKGFEPYLPIVGYTSIDDDTYKISARCSRLLTFGTIHLGKAIRRAACATGGEGGGHAPACGAYLRKDRLEEFLTSFECEITIQKNQSQNPS